MGTPGIPICYFPSKVIFVDDSKDFLVNFSLQLSSTLNYELYDSPHHALDVLHNLPEKNPFHQRGLSTPLDTTGSPSTIDALSINLASMLMEPYNPQRFAEVTVLVVDYSMPSINGLELCEQIKSPFIRKILLTGRADESTGLDAFNAGLIDFFIQKNDPTIIEKVNHSISRLQRRYFQDMSMLATTMLAMNGLRCLQDAKFANFFQEICQQQHIVEYYLVENSGSFLLLDMYAYPSCLVVKNQAEMQHCYEMAMDNQVPAHVLQQLKQGLCIPLFWPTQNPHVNEWDNCEALLHPAKKIECDETYYYALVKNPVGVQIDRITSYHHYLDQQDSPAVK